MESMVQHGMKPFIPLMMKAHDTVIDIPNRVGLPIEARLDNFLKPWVEYIRVRVDLSAFQHSDFQPTADKPENAEVPHAVIRKPHLIHWRSRFPKNILQTSF